MTIENLNLYLKFDWKYKLSDIDRRVLNPATDELKIIYRIRVHKKYEKRKNSGDIGSLLKLNKRKKLKQCSNSRIDSKSILGKTNRYCPRCHEQYIRSSWRMKMAHIIYGHTDFKTGDYILHMTLPESH